MQTEECDKMMELGRKLFREEKAKRIGKKTRFACLTDHETGETVFFSPDKESSKGMLQSLHAEHIKI